MKKILFAFLLLLMPFMVRAVENVKIPNITGEDFIRNSSVGNYYVSRFCTDSE